MVDVTFAVPAPVVSFIMVPQLNIAGVGDLAQVAVRLTQQFNTTDVWYRGHSCSSFKLQPTLIRKGYSPEVECGLYEEFRIRAVARHRDFPVGGDPVSAAHRMTMMRHYGVPTRLLDWTAAPIIAAFFAVSEACHKCDGVLWALCPRILNEMRMGTGGILNLAGEMASPELCAIYKGNISTVTFAARSPEVDPRMFVQQGSYTFHGDPPIPLEDSPDADKFLVKLVIASNLRADFATYLLALGVRLSSIYPDLGHLATDIQSTRSLHKLLFNPATLSPCACP